MCIKKRKNKDNLICDKTPELFTNKIKNKNLKLVTRIIITICSIATTIIIIQIIMPIVFLLGMLIYHIPEGELIEEVVSPSKEYTLQSYLISNDKENLLKNKAISVVVLDNETKITSAIYYDYHENKVTMKWIDEETVQINGIKLNIHEDRYNRKIEITIDILKITAIVIVAIIGTILIVKKVIEKKHNIKKEKKLSVYTYIKNTNIIDQLIKIFIFLNTALIIIFCITYLIFILYLIIFENILGTDIPNTGKQVDELVSPNEEYTLKSYFLEGDSLSANATRVEVYNNDTKEAKNIYYNYRENEVTMKWIDEDTVQINDIELNIHKEKYDWRKER